MMLLRARDSNIQSFACIWLNKGNQNEFLTHPKITQNFEYINVVGCRIYVLNFQTKYAIFKILPTPFDQSLK